MKKVNNVFKRVLNFKVIPVVLVFIAGALFGGLAVSKYLDNKKTQSAKYNPGTNEFRTKSISQRQLEAYEEAKADLAEGINNGRLSKEKADALTKKVEEAYTFVKENPGETAQARAKIRAKRLEWRKWAQENDIPSSYFIRLY